jgi:hypothetical protein
MTEPNWAMLARPRRPAPDPDDQKWATLHLRLFSTPDGKEWLEAMRAILFDSPQRDDISESKLRHLEAQRQMLRDIERLMAKGLANLERKSQAG